MFLLRHQLVKLREGNWPRVRGGVAGNDANMRALVRDLVRGGVAGAVATVPMSMVMLGAQRAGALPKQPPEEIVDTAAEKTVGRQPPEPVSNALAVAAHLGFGAGAGIGYTALRRVTGGRGPATAVGVAYALGVWFTSYQGWVPGLGALPATTRDREDRQAVMAGAHVVYGAVLGHLAERR